MNPYQDGGNGIILHSATDIDVQASQIFAKNGNASMSMDSYNSEIISPQKKGNGEHKFVTPRTIEDY